MGRGISPASCANTSAEAACGLPPKIPERQQSASDGESSRSNQWQLTLFGFEEHPLLDEIRATNLDDLSPREAVNLIHAWQEQLATVPAKAK